MDGFVNNINNLTVDSTNQSVPIGATDGVSPSVSPTVSANQESSLKTAEAKGAEKAREMAGVPILPPPQQLQDYDFSLQNILAPIGNSHTMMTVQQADMLITSMIQQATGKILTTWVEGLQKDAQYKQIVDKMQEQRQQVLDAIKMNQQLQQTNKDSSKQSVQKAATYALLVSAGMLALGLGTTTNSVGLVSFATLKEVTGVVAAIAPSTLDGVLGSIVGVFGGGIITQAGLLTLKSANQNPQKYNFEFAKNYSVRTLTIVNGNELDQAVATVFATAGNDVITSKTTLAKVALLSQALAFAYHLETGSLSGPELAGMLQGKIVFDKDDFRNPVIAALNYQIAQLPADKRSQVVEKLMEYFDSKPDLGELSEPANAIRALFGSAGSVSTPIAG